MICGNGAHCGDALWALSYLLRKEGEHELYVKPEFVRDFSLLACGSKVTVGSTDNLPSHAQDTWIANGANGSSYQNQRDILGFVFDYFNNFGIAWKDRKEMLLDIPWIKPEKWRDTILFLNTQPMSGQCNGYVHSEVNKLAHELTLDGQRVVTVCEEDGSHKYSLIQIACLSAHAKLIIGGASGPFFITMNTASQNAHRIVFLENMVLDYGPEVGPIHMVSNASEARKVLKDHHYFRYREC